MIPDIIITSVPERHKNLKNTLRYLSNYKGKIIVVINRHKSNKFLKKFKKKNVKIIFSNKKYRVEKVWEGLKHVKSISVLQMADDDLYNLDYIYEAGKILNRNSKFVAVDCFHLCFDFKMKKYINDHDALKYYQVKKNNFKIEGSNYYKRLKSIKDNLIYNKRIHSSVVRTSLYKKISYFAFKYQKDIHTHFTDQLFYLYYLMVGEIYTVNKLGAIYSINQSVREGYYFHKNMKNYEFFQNFYTHKSSVKQFIQIIKTNLNVNENKAKIILKNYWNVLKKINQIHENDRAIDSKLNRLTKIISRKLKIYYKNFRYFRNHFHFPSMSKNFEIDANIYFDNLKF